MPVVMLAACNSHAKSSPKAGSTITTAVGVEVSGAFGATPTIVVPAKPAPTALTQQTLAEGSGTILAKGDTLVANYVGQTWDPKAGKPHVFDSSFARRWLRREWAAERGHHRHRHAGVRR